jgi:hypothetical protein
MYGSSAETPMATQSAPLVARSNCSTWPPVFDSLISASS